MMYRLGYKLGFWLGYHAVEVIGCALFCLVVYAAVAGWHV